MKKFLAYFTFVLVFILSSTFVFAEEEVQSDKLNELFEQLDLNYIMEEDISLNFEEMYYNMFLALNSMNYIEESDESVLLEEYDNYKNISEKYYDGISVMAENIYINKNFNPKDTITNMDIKILKSTTNFYLKKNGYRFIYKEYLENINGNEYMDKAILYGIDFHGDSNFLTEITIKVILDYSQIYYIEVEDVGYFPILQFNNFTEDNNKDILVSIDSGGSGEITFSRIYSFNKGYDSFISIFNLEEYRVDIDIDYADDYKVIVTSDTEVNVIDISTREEVYLNNLYDNEGKLKENKKEITITGVNCYPYDMDNNGIFEILIKERISGVSNADTLGYLETIYKYEYGEFIEIK